MDGWMDGISRFIGRFQPVGWLGGELVSFTVVDLGV